MEYAKHHQKPGKPLRPATMAHLVKGARLYLGDPRQTPVEVVQTDPQTASFTVSVADFEDRGALWEFPLWEVDRFHVMAGAPELSRSASAALSVRVTDLQRPLTIPCQPDHKVRTQARILARAARIKERLHTHRPAMPATFEDLLGLQKESTVLSAALQSVLKEAGLLQMEQEFSSHFVSNPHAGEMVKAHRIVLAEMGLCPYEGEMLRNPALLEGQWAPAARRAHIEVRLAFFNALAAVLGQTELALFRTIYSDDDLQPPINRGFVSATFHRDVALALLEAGQARRNAALYFQRVPVSRVFMTYLETPALNQTYQEAEAILLHDPAARPF